MKVIASNKINYNSNKTTADSLMLIDFDSVFILILAFQGKQKYMDKPVSQIIKNS